MRILLVGDYPPDPRLGSTKVLVKLQEEFRALGHTCDLLLADGLDRAPHNPYLRQAFGPVAAWSAVHRMFKTHGLYDVVDVASAEGLWIASLGRAALGDAVVISRSNGLEHLNYRRVLDDAAAGLARKPWTRRLFHPAVRLTQVAAAARAADRLLLLNEGDRAFALERHWKAGARIDVVPHGVSRRFLTDTPSAHDKRGRGILFCGTWTPVKGVTYLAQAFSRLVGAGLTVNLTILGGAVPDAEIRAAFSEAARPFLTLVDRAPESVVMTAYRSHDVLVWPSTYEGFGMVVIEAMSQRLPVVATPVGCAQSLIVSEETGLIVPPRDPVALAAALERMLTDGDLRARCAAAAFERVRGMTWTQTAELTLDVYRRAIEARVGVHANPAQAGSHVSETSVGSHVSETNPAEAGSHVSEIDSRIPHSPHSQIHISQHMSHGDFKLTVGIATRNRPASLLRCLNSLALIDDLVGEVIVVDDSSDPPVGSVIRQVSSVVAHKIRLVEQLDTQGYIVARNTMVRLAANECVFLLDDDAYVIDAAAVRQAVAIFQRHPTVGAVACAQAEADGSPWPVGMQPSPVAYVCYVAAYIGFAHLLRRSVFLDLGAYQESFRFYGEEKDYCLRLLDAGYDVVYLPDARVAHVPDPSGRSETRYLRYVVRNDCLSALYNEPLPMLILSVPVRLLRYVAMRRHGRVSDPGGLRWIAGELVKALPRVWRGRKPIRWASIRRWRRLSRDWPHFVSHPAPSV